MARCPARPWNHIDLYPECTPVEVFFPKGTYFVEGVWKTAYPQHSSADPYKDQWVVFTLPRGVAIRGVGMEGIGASAISLIKKNDCLLNRNSSGSPSGSNKCRNPRFDKRTGTHLFMAGFEKMTDFCDSAITPTNPIPKNPGAKNNLLCSASSTEKRASGAQNYFQDIALIGDRLAVANDWSNGDLKTQSTAIHTYRSRDIRLFRVKTDNWYRAINSREGNGVSVAASKIRNNFKASIYLTMPYSLRNPPPPEVDNFNMGYTTASRLPIVIDNNDIVNEPSFFTLLKGKGAAPWGALTGVYVTGHVDTVGCSDTSIINNRLTYSKIYYEQPCAKVLIQENSVSYTGMPIQVGSYENNNGLNYAVSVAIIGNKIHKSVSGILIRGCQYNIGTARCIGDDAHNWPLIAPVVRDNVIDTFLPLSGVGSDIWVNEMARSGKTLGGIVLADVSLVTIDNNKINDLRIGSQSFGIGVQKSRWNTQHAGTVLPNGTVLTNQTANCYKPITRSRGVTISRNSISYSTLPNGNIGLLGLRDAQGPKTTAVGVYVEYSDDVLYTSPGAMAGVAINRMIDSTFRSPAPTGDFCFAPATGSSSACPRRIDSSSSLMSRTCSPTLEVSCYFTIPNTPSNENAALLREFYSGICTSRDASDEEMMFR